MKRLSVGSLLTYGIESEPELLNNQLTLKHISFGNTLTNTIYALVGCHDMLSADHRKPNLGYSEPYQVKSDLR